MKNILKRIGRGLPDSLDRVVFSLFIVNVIFSGIKLILLIPNFRGDAGPMLLLIVSLVACVLITCLLIIMPHRLLQWTMIGLVLMAIYPFIFVMVAHDPVNLVVLLHILIVIMLAYYCIGRAWGLVSSAVFSGGILLYLVGVESGKYQISLFPSSTSLYVTLSLVLISFIQLSFIHFLYNRARITTLNDMRILNAKLNKSIAAKSEFLSTMSHELRTPLNSLMGTAYLLVDEDQNEVGRKENIHALKRSAEHLLALINNILDFSKMDSAHTRLDHIPFSVGVIFEQSVDILRQKAVSKGLDLSLNMDRGTQDHVLIGDPTRLRQIIFNLLANAIKFTSKGSVVIDVQLIPKSGAHVMLSARITDTGVGIDPEDLDKIFDPFSTFKNTEYGGTGIGLTIVKHLVELHHGHLSVDSQPGIGSTFHVHIPYSVKRQDKPTEKSEASKNSMITKRDHSQMRLLLAEDNQMSVAFMKQLLRKWQVTPVIATDGKQVVDFIKEGQIFDLILMDIRMPKMTGLEAAKFIREYERGRDHYTSIIALTASVSSEIARQLDEIGFDDYLSKPFTPNDLLDKIEKLIQIKSKASHKS